VREHHSDKRLLRLWAAISRRCRDRRRALFFEQFALNPETRLLDLGGSADWDWGCWPNGQPQITILNREADVAGEGAPVFVCGDARDLSRWPDKHFDVVFSNSVIEHVGDWDDQRQMASEIRRVAKSYWVQTPNRHFPVEPHMMFPFFQYLPLAWRRWLARRWPLSFERLRGGDPVRDAEEVRLLTRRDLEHCFPDAAFLRERFMGLTKSWIAVRHDPDR
jgi:hypothetical protein